MRQFAGNVKHYQSLQHFLKTVYEKLHLLFIEQY